MQALVGALNHEKADCENRWTTLRQQETQNCFVSISPHKYWSGIIWRNTLWCRLCGYLLLNVILQCSQVENVEIFKSFNLMPQQNMNTLTQIVHWVGYCNLDWSASQMVKCRLFCSTLKLNNVTKMCISSLVCKTNDITPAQLQMDHVIQLVLQTIHWL